MNATCFRKGGQRKIRHGLHAVDTGSHWPYVPRQLAGGFRLRLFLAISKGTDMKIRNSLRALMGRHRDNKLVRRRGRYYIINKVNKRFKARQG